MDARDGKETLLLCDPSGGRVVKTTLAGEIVLELPQAKDCGAYDAVTKCAPTEAAMAPNGDIYVADGYGSLALIQDGAVIQRILRHLGRPDVVPEMRPSRAPPLPFDPYDDPVSGDDD